MDSLKSTGIEHSLVSAGLGKGKKLSDLVLHITTYICCLSLPPNLHAIGICGIYVLPSWLPSFVYTHTHSHTHPINIYVYQAH